MRVCLLFALFSILSCIKERKNISAIHISIPVAFFHDVILLSKLALNEFFVLVLEANMQLIMRVFSNNVETRAILSLPLSIQKFVEELRRKEKFLHLIITNNVNFVLWLPWFFRIMFASRSAESPHAEDIFNEKVFHIITS